MKSLRLHRNDLEDDISAYLSERLPCARIETILDVGANIGWFTWQFSKHYPHSRYFLFEPITPIALQMHENLNRLGLLDRLEISLHQLALGSEPGMVLATSIPDCTINHIVRPFENLALLTATGETPTELVRVETGDAFCASRDIRRIDYLKIDCEGHDIEVLQGFQAMLSLGRVAFVQVECRIGRDRSEFSDGCSFEDVDALLAGMGYCLFRFLNQASNRLPFASRADVVWILKSYAEHLADEHGS